MPKVQVPEIVASIADLNLDQNVAQTIPLFTPTVDGVFRVSLYATTASPSSVLAPFHLNWTDEFGSHSVVLGTPSNGTFSGNAQGVVGSTSFLHALANTAITLTVDANTGAPAYSVYGEVEQF